MGFWDIFKPKGDTISKTLDSTNNIVKTVGSFITKDLPPEQKGEIISKYLDINKEILSYQRDIITTEMKGNWLQRSWRPLLSLSLVLIIGINYLFLPILGWFGLQLTPIVMPKQLWTLLTIAIGGYVGGRSAEKIVDNLGKK